MFVVEGIQRKVRISFIDKSTWLLDVYHSYRWCTYHFLSFHLDKKSSYWSGVPVWQSMTSLLDRILNNAKIMRSYLNVLSLFNLTSVILRYFVRKILYNQISVCGFSLKVKILLDFSFLKYHFSNSLTTNNLLRRSWNRRHFDRIWNWAQVVKFMGNKKDFLGLI